MGPQSSVHRDKVCTAYGSHVRTASTWRLQHRPPSYSMPLRLPPVRACSCQEPPRCIHCHVRHRAIMCLPAAPALPRLLIPPLCLQAAAGTEHVPPLRPHRNCGDELRILHQIGPGEAVATKVRNEGQPSTLVPRVGGAQPQPALSRAGRLSFLHSEGGNAGQSFVSKCSWGIAPIVL